VDEGEGLPKVHLGLEIGGVGDTQEIGPEVGGGQAEGDDARMAWVEGIGPGPSRIEGMAPVDLGVVPVRGVTIDMIQVSGSDV
jgi:hypothetical protein